MYTLRYINESERKEERREHQQCWTIVRMVQYVYIETYGISFPNQIRQKHVPFTSPLASLNLYESTTSDLLTIVPIILSVLVLMPVRCTYSDAQCWPFYKSKSSYTVTQQQNRLRTIIYMLLHGTNNITINCLQVIQQTQQFLPFYSSAHTTVDTSGKYKLHISTYSHPLWGEGGCTFMNSYQSPLYNSVNSRCKSHVCSLRLPHTWTGAYNGSNFVVQYSR